MAIDWGTVAGAGANALSGYLAYLKAKGEDDRADALQKDAADAYGNVTDESVRAAAEKILGPTALAQIHADPKYRAAQDDALASLKDISNSGGFNLQDRAVLNDRQNETAQADQRRRASNLESLSARGQAGSGTEIGMLIAGQQAAANRDSAAGMHAAADAQARSLKAIADAGMLAGNMESTDYNRQADTAKAQDEIDRFNNTSQYNRANDAYSRQLGALDKQYGFARDQASNTRSAGARDSAFIANMGRAGAQAATGAGRNATASEPSAPGTGDEFLAANGLAADYTPSEMMLAEAKGNNARTAEVGPPRKPDNGERVADVSWQDWDPSK